MNDQGYLLANRAAEAQERFDALSALFDPCTFRHMEALGIAHGFRCWEVGVGGASVVRWLADRVGPSGRVLATDIDVSRAELAASSVVEVRRHDVALDAAPSEEFDLVHARLVLVHVVERERALAKMVDVLRPGGWLLVEDADPALQPLACLDVRGKEEELANKIRHAFRSLMAARGVDLGYGRKLPKLLRAAGLARVAADAYFPVTAAASATLEMATVNLVRENLLTSGLATVEEIEENIANLASGNLDVVTSPMISAWGQKE